jgi:predicted ATPase
VAHLLRVLAMEQPLVIVIEDLHWCDEMTVRLLRFLPRRLEGQPVLLVGTARPEEMLSGPRRVALLDALLRDPETACQAR